MPETRLLLRGTPEASRQIASDPANERALNRCHDFGLLIRMFGHFVDSAHFRGQPVNIDYFLRKTCIPFIGDSNIPYLSTILSVDCADNYRVHFKFANVGFVYEKDGEQFPHHESDGWVNLPDRPLFPSLAEALPYHTRGSFTYSYNAHRLDIHLFSSQPELADVVVTFEGGRPYVDALPLAVPLCPAPLCPLKGIQSP